MEKHVTVLKVLFEDDAIIAVEKPSGILAQSDKSGSSDILSLTKTYLRVQKSAVPNFFLGLVHRLDKPVSGVMVFAKTKRAAALLNRQFNRHTIHKIYYAVIEGFPGTSGEMRDHLIKDEQRSIKRIAEESEHGARYAELEFKTIDTRGNLSCVRIHPLTGRSHQIRLQFAHRGFPIVGDRIYGSRIVLPDNAIALWAQSIQFAHPRSGQRVTIESAGPSVWPAEFNIKQIVERIDS